MRNIVVAINICLLIVLFSCIHDDPKAVDTLKKERDLLIKEKSLKVKEDSINFVISSVKTKDIGQSVSNNTGMNRYEHFYRWYQTLTKCGLTFSNEMLNKSAFDPKYYSGNPKSNFIMQIRSLKKRTTPELSFSNDLLLAGFQNEDFLEDFYFLERKIIYTYHASIGSRGGTSVYDLIDQVVTNFPFTIYGIKNDIAEISEDGYDDLGHYWQKGKFNIVTLKFYWETLEH